MSHESPRVIPAEVTPFPGGYTMSVEQRRVCASSRVAPNELRELLSDPEILFTRGDAQIIKQSPSTLLVRLSIRMGGAEVECGYKKLIRKTWLKRVSDIFRPRDRSRHSFEMGHRLLEAGIPTPEPLWVSPASRFRWNEPAYIAFEWLPGCRDLNAHFGDYILLRESDPESARKKICSVVSELATVLGKMHGAGYCHRDLKFSNLLVDDRGSVPHIFVIDLDGASATRGDVRRWLWNLSRLATDAIWHPEISRAVRCRFLKTYLSVNPRCDVDWKTAWRMLSQLIDKRIRRRRVR